MENRSLDNVKGTACGWLAVLAFIAAALIGGCDRAEKRGPGRILNHEEMVRVLLDIYVTEQKVNRLTLEKDSADKLFALMEGKIFEKAGIPDSVFRASFDYYYERPKEIELIYTAVVDSLQLMEQRAPLRNASQ